MATRAYLLLAPVLVLAIGCSIDTSRIRANADTAAGDVASESSPDVQTDAGIDASIDAGDDTGTDAPGDVPTDTHMRSLVGHWRVSAADITTPGPGGTHMTTSITDTGVITCNGLVAITPTSVGATFAIQFTGHVPVAESNNLCPIPRLLQASAFGYTGTLDEGSNTFQIANTSPVTVLTFDWTQPADAGDASPDNFVRVSLPSDTTGVGITLTLTRPVVLLGAATLHTQGAVITRTDDHCTTGPTLANPRVAIVWENPTPVGGQVGLPGPSFAAMLHTPATGGSYWTYDLAIQSLPPALTLVGGVQIAIGYIVLFDDLNNNMTFDHSWVMPVTVGSPDRVWGVSNLAVAYRGVGTPDSSFAGSPFADTFSGYQIVAIGPDYRAHGSTAPWVQNINMVPAAGAIPTDITPPVGVFGPWPVSGDGVAQVTMDSSTLPHLLP